MAIETNEIRVTACNDQVACVKLTGEFYSDNAANEVVTQLTGLFSTGIISILLDLSNAKIHRSLVDKIVPLHKQAEREGQELIIQWRSK